MFEARKVMTTNPVSIRKDATIYDTIKLLAENDFTGLPVVNEDMTLAGIVTEKDVLKLLSDLETLMLSSELEESQARIEDFMTDKVVSFDERSDLLAVCECLIKNAFRRVPITCEGKLVGIISRRDIIRYILEPFG